MTDPDPLRGLPEALRGLVLPGSEGHSYPLGAPIGEGAQGWVFRATWNGSVDVVVKVLRPDAANQESLARFQREAQVLRTLSQQRHPNPHVVRFFDHAYARVEVAGTGRSWDLPFTVLEFVEGETLEKTLEKAPAGLGLDRARRILRHVVLALEDVHARNVVHRDLKPSNILLSRASGREIAKVTDFGLAKLLGAGIAHTGHVAGATIGYAPPEQFEDGNRRVGRPTDVFSLAAIFFEMVTGHPAFPVDGSAHPLVVVARLLSEAPPTLATAARSLPRELAERPDVVAAFDAELTRALSIDPAQRHPTAMALFEAFERALSTLGSTPSLPDRRSAGVVVVRPSSPPDEPVLPPLPPLPSMVAGGMPGAPTPATAVPSIPSPGRDIARAGALKWLRITEPLQPGAFRTIAVARAGGRAAALGARAPAQWLRGGYTRLDMPGGVDGAAMLAIAWMGDRLVVAGASPVVAMFAGGGPPALARIDVPGVVFRAVFADGAGVVLAGERRAAAGPVPIVAELPLHPRGFGAPGVTDVAGCGTLRAVVRAGTTVFACGDAGALVALRAQEPPRVAYPCAATLTALLAEADGSVSVVGGGGFAFRVSPELDAQLEAMQTTRDLHAIARGPGEATWCGGDAGRVLRRAAGGWTRMGADGADARVLALHAAGHRLRAFCDDGSVYEGTAK